MKAFLASILTVIAMGIMAIAYGLLSPRMAGVDAYPYARPMLASERVPLDGGSAMFNYPNNGFVPYTSTGAVARPAVYQTTAPAPARVSTVRRSASSSSVERASGRDWTKTALIIGGTTAAGAGIGGMIGGKKGALIGAAIGGGASTLYEARK